MNKAERLASLEAFVGRLAQTRHFSIDSSDDDLEVAVRVLNEVTENARRVMDRLRGTKERP